MESSETVCMESVCVCVSPRQQPLTGSTLLRTIFCASLDIAFTSPWYLRWLQNSGFPGRCLLASFPSFRSRWEWNHQPERVASLACKPYVDAAQAIHSPGIFLMFFGPGICICPGSRKYWPVMMSQASFTRRGWGASKCGKKNELSEYTQKKGWRTRKKLSTSFRHNDNVFPLHDTINECVVMK